MQITESLMKKVYHSWAGMINLVRINERVIVCIHGLSPSQQEQVLQCDFFTLLASVSCLLILECDYRPD